jgi:glycosyltransferase involved in cell wall biosynthesis
MKVSVGLVTYNHARYIDQAIAGVLMQNCPFDWELVIGDDCSTDTTLNIAQSYERSYPHQVQVISCSVNTGSVHNLVRVLQACRGEYIALLDGDDYWTSETKLRKQVEYLDSHPGISACFHNAQVIYEDSSHQTRDYCPPELKETTSISDLLHSNYIPTCSVMFRNGLIDYVPDWFYQVSVYDYPLHILNAQHGNLGYINENMAVYRVHRGGIWSLTSFRKQLVADLDLFSVLAKVLGANYQTVITDSVRKRWRGLKRAILDETEMLTGVPEVFGRLELILNSLPATIAPPAGWKSALLAEIYARSAFTCYVEGDLEGTRRCWFQALRYNPTWIRNRGLWSIGLRSLIGIHNHLAG